MECEASPENAMEITVPSMNRAKAHLMRGNRKPSPENRRAAIAKPSRIWQTAIDNVIDTAEAKVSPTAARDKKDCWELMDPKLQYGRGAFDMR